MSYQTSKQRVEALEALARAYNLIMTTRVVPSAEPLLDAIKNEAQKIQLEQKKKVDSEI